MQQNNCGEEELRAAAAAAAGAACTLTPAGHTGELQPPCAKAKARGVHASPKKCCFDLIYFTLKGHQHCFQVQMDGWMDRLGFLDG